ncbi:MAG TPA: hypothetical protein P5136_02285 [Methanofastidiosum sp.]|nr:hypothetical protein [Methanofastidiosum sp.]
MKVHDIFESAKFLNTDHCDLKTISSMAPVKIMYALRNFRIIDTTGQEYRLTFDGITVSPFQNKLRDAIENEDFDVLDNIILDFFKGYHIHLWGGKLYISFPEENINSFVNICNNFKGKKWDEIVQDFFISLYTFMLSGSLGPYPIVD